MNPLVLLALVLTVGLAPAAFAADASVDACHPPADLSPDCPVGATVNRGCSGEPLTTVCVYP